MNEGLEKLIDLAIASGELNEKNRNVIYRKADALKIDRDEIDLIIDGKLHLMKKGIKEVSIKKEENSVSSLPKIVKSEKVEVPFKDCEWNQNMEMEIEVGLKSAKSVIAMGITPTTSLFKINIEHYRTEGGYNVRIISRYAFADSIIEREKEHVKTEFVPIEYEEQEVSLDFSNQNLKRIEEITSQYPIEEIHSLNRLVLDNNPIESFSGLSKFEKLEEISIRGCMLTEWPNELNSSIQPRGPIEDVNLENNSLKTLKNVLVPWSQDMIELDLHPLCTRIKLSGNKIMSDTSETVLLKNGTQFKVWLNESGLYQAEEIKLKNETEKQTTKSSSSGNSTSTKKYNCKKCGAKIQKTTVDKTGGYCTRCKGGCFIATAAMGSEHHPKVSELRLFRDEWILRKSWGLDFVNWYYKYGSIAANYIKKSTFLKQLVCYTVVYPLNVLSKILRNKK